MTTPKKQNLRFLDMLSLSLRVFRMRPTRTLLTIMGISLGIGVVLFLVSLGFGLQYILLGKLASTEDSLRSIEVYYPTESNLPIRAQEISQITSLPETSEISPSTQFTGEIKNGVYSGYVMFNVVNPNYFRLSGTSVDSGVPLAEKSSTPGIVISTTALRLINLPENATSLGKKIDVTILYQPTKNVPASPVVVPEQLPIVGIISEDTSSPFVYVSSDLLTGMSYDYTSVFVKATSIDTVSTLSTKLINQGFVISARLDLVNQARNAMNIITIILGIFGATALVVSAIGMFNTMLISFLERVFEIGIMKSLGATSGNIRNLILTESFVVGVLGGIGGVVCGVISGQVINFVLNFIIAKYGASPLNLFIYPPQFVIAIIVLSGLVGVSAGLWPAHKAVQLSPKEAFQRQ